MDKNNKKTMSEKKHNPSEIFKYNNTSNDSNPDNTPNEEFSAEWDAKVKNKIDLSSQDTPQSNKRK
ncbi:hypothetical protein ACMGD3_13535 [Lysinibacillus sphaericus]|uniref:hypothetical protein n=1 Tax=Lysinibacillus sphaericus TaxID=1421 RepID=UPI001C5E76EA